MTTLVYTVGVQRHVERVACCDLHVWVHDHPDAVVLSSTPDRR